MATAVKKMFKATPNKVKNPASLNKNARKLVNALRGENNKKCVGYLCKIGKKGSGIKSNCVLGLACELYIKAGGRLKTKIEYEEGNSAILTYDGKDMELPGKVQRWLGFNSPSGTYGDLDVNFDQRSLAGNNDSGMSFSKLADLIESKPENLFRKGY